MIVLFNDDYSNRDIFQYVEMCRKGNASVQSLYGALHLEDNGVQVKFLVYKHHKPRNRKLLAIYDMLQILFKGGHYDAIFSQSYRGLELLMLLRSLHLFHKPIYVWQHAALKPDCQSFVSEIKRFILRGIDEMFFFNEIIAQESVQTGKIRHYKVVPFGGDVAFCDSLSAPNASNNPLVFLSTGKENRDFPTLVNTFKDLDAKLIIYTFKSNGDNDYEEYLSTVHEKNVEVHLLEKPLPPKELLAISKKADCILISTTKLPYKYPCGLTSLVEAMALGKPVITTHNPYYGIDVEHEGIGFSIYKVEQWRETIQKCIDSPALLNAMGKQAYKLAQETYNIENTSRIIAEEIKKHNEMHI